MSPVIPGSYRPALQAMASRNTSHATADVTPSSEGTPRRRGRPHLGEREVVKAALNDQELALVDALRGGLERSAFLGVVITEHVGRTDLLPRADQLSLVDDALNDAELRRLVDKAIASGAVTGPSTPARRPAKRQRRPDATVRVHPEVRREVERRRQRLGIPQNHYNADVIRERLGLAPRMARSEALPLAM